MMTLGKNFIADLKISQTASGLAGEYIAAASVLARGWRVALAQQDSVDLIAWHPDSGLTLRIQVKACQSSRQGGGRNRVHFQTGLGGQKRLPTLSDFDILACVSSDQRTVWYIPVTSIREKKLTRNITFFSNPELERESWSHALDTLGVKEK